MIPIRTLLLPLLALAVAACASSARERIWDRGSQTVVLDHGLLVSHQEIAPEGMEDASDVAVHLLVLVPPHDSVALIEGREPFATSVTPGRGRVGISFAHGRDGGPLEAVDVELFTLADHRWLETPSGRFDLEDGNLFTVDLARGAAAYRQLPGDAPYTSTPGERLTVFRCLLADDAHARAVAATYERQAGGAPASCPGEAVEPGA